MHANWPVCLSHNQQPHGRHQGQPNGLPVSVWLSPQDLHLASQHVAVVRFGRFLPESQCVLHCAKEMLGALAAACNVLQLAGLVFNLGLGRDMCEVMG